MLFTPLPSAPLLTLPNRSSQSSSTPSLPGKAFAVMETMYTHVLGYFSRMILVVCNPSSIGLKLSIRDPSSPSGSRSSPSRLPLVSLSSPARLTLSWEGRGGERGEDSYKNSGRTTCSRKNGHRKSGT